MLKRRVYTALALLAVILPALLSSIPWVWPAVSFVLVILAAWEWMRMLKPARANVAALATLASFGLCIIYAFGSGHPLLAEESGVWSGLILAACGLAALFWICLAPWQLSVLRTDLNPAWTAVLVLCAAWLAVLQLHRSGLGELFSGLALVWVADIAAYFVGRRFGRTRLAPRISPGKTREGALGASFAVVGLSFAVYFFGQPQWPTILTTRWLESLSMSIPRGLAMVLWVLLLLMLVTLSILGDLYESMVKREAGVKDSSGLLPGHGGVLDRLDALLPVLPTLVVIDYGFAWISSSR